MSSSNFPGLPDPPADKDPAVYKWMQDITDTLRQGTGQVGGTPWVTWSGLVDSGIVQRVSTGTGGSGVGGSGGSTGPGIFVPTTPPVDTSPPPTPKNVRTSGSPTAIRILWDDPKLNYSYRAEVFMGTLDDVGQATLIGSSNGTIFQIVMGSDVAPKFFWVRFVRGTGTETVTGPWNQTAGTVGQVQGELIDAQLGTLDVDKLIGGTADFVSANILDGTITNAKIGDTIQSNNYQPGRQGWCLKK